MTSPIVGREGMCFIIGAVLDKPRNEGGHGVDGGEGEKRVPSTRYIFDAVNRRFVFTSPLHCMCRLTCAIA